MLRRVAMGLLATSGMKVLDSARTSVDRVYNGSKPCLGRANEVAREQEQKSLLLTKLARTSEGSIKRASILR